MLPAHGDALQAGAVARLGLAFPVDDLARAPRLRQQRTLVRLEHAPDQVLAVQGLAGGGTGLTHHHERRPLLALDRHEKEDVGEREVGEEHRRRQQALQVSGAALVERGVLANELDERGHGARP